MAASKTDYYDILGVSKNSSSEEIKKAYRKQALEWHPDKHKENKEAAERRFKEINEAYQVLSDSQKRSSYDQFGSAGPSPFAGGRGGQSGPFTYTYTTNGNQGMPFDFGDPFEIFEQFFGGGFARQSRVPRYSIALEFMEAIKGVTKEVSIGGKKRRIKIPAGIDEGSRINFDDFVLSVNVKPHDNFERDNEDIYVTVAISYSIAVLGGELKVPTVDGDVNIRIRPGTKPGTMMRLRGKGVTRLRGGGRGDEYVKISIISPEKLTREQKKLIEELREIGL